MLICRISVQLHEFLKLTALLRKQTMRELITQVLTKELKREHRRILEFNKANDIK